MSTRKRGGKAAFYRLGFIAGFNSRQPQYPSERVQEWPQWALLAWSIGESDGRHQRRHALCVH